MKPQVIVLQHVAMEGPGRLVAAAARAGLQLCTVPLHEGAPVPDVHPRDVLVVMGGPMSVGDVGNPSFPYLGDELALLQKRVNQRAPTLGICLGAQMIARAAGARVFPNIQDSTGEGTSTPVIELGWAPVDFLPEPTEPLLRGLRRQEMVLHWHSDTFDLPQGAVHVAATAICRHQAFHLDHKIIGLQFHCEVAKEDVARWVRDDAAYVARARGPRGGEAVLEETRALAPDTWHAGDRLLDNVLRCLTG